MPGLSSNHLTGWDRLAKGVNHEEGQRTHELKYVVIDSENEAEEDDNVEQSPSGDSASQRFVDELNVLGEKSWNKSMGRYELDQKILQKEKEIDELESECDIFEKVINDMILEEANLSVLFRAQRRAKVDCLEVKKTKAPLGSQCLRNIETKNENIIHCAKENANSLICMESSDPVTIPLKNKKKSKRKRASEQLSKEPSRLARPAR